MPIGKTVGRHIDNVTRMIGQQRAGMWDNPTMKAAPKKSSGSKKGTTGNVLVDSFLKGHARHKN